MYKKKPFFIVFEGVEGCGKSYQSKKLYNRLKKDKIDTILTREPGGTKSSELIRNLILKDYFTKNNREKFDKYTDTLLYLAARNEHIKNKIKPALIKKKVVICDRFIDSTIAYQVHGKKVDINFINNIHRKILQDIKPNVVFVLKVSKNSSRKRLKKRKTNNRYDNFPQSFYDKAQ
jgi:dTMP kinase